MCSRWCLFFCILFFSFPINTLADFVYNASYDSTCAPPAGCNFLSPEIWVGEIAPNSSAPVIIQSSNKVLLYINISYESDYSAEVVLSYVELTGNITLWIQTNISFISNTLIANNFSIVQVDIDALVFGRDWTLNDYSNLLVSYANVTISSLYTYVGTFVKVVGTGALLQTSDSSIDYISITDGATLNTTRLTSVRALFARDASLLGDLTLLQIGRVVNSAVVFSHLMVIDYAVLNITGGTSNIRFLGILDNSTISYSDTVSRPFQNKKDAPSHQIGSFTSAIGDRGTLAVTDTNILLGPGFMNAVIVQGQVELVFWDGPDHLGNPASITLLQQINGYVHLNVNITVSITTSNLFGDMYISEFGIVIAEAMNISSQTTQQLVTGDGALVVGTLGIEQANASISNIGLKGTISASTLYVTESMVGYFASNVSADLIIQGQLNLNVASLSITGNYEQPEGSTLCVTFSALNPNAPVLQITGNMSVYGKINVSIADANANLSTSTPTRFLLAQYGTNNGVLEGPCATVAVSLGADGSVTQEIDRDTKSIYIVFTPNTRDDMNFWEKWYVEISISVGVIVGVFILVLALYLKRNHGYEKIKYSNYT